MEIKSIIDIFDEIAKENMKYWNLEEFKRTHPSLFNVIILTAHEYAGQSCRCQSEIIKDFPEYFARK